jgi:hypothetical protein
MINPPAINTLRKVLKKNLSISFIIPKLSGSD